MTPSLHGEGVMGSSLSRFPTLEDLLPSFPSVPLRSSPWISVTHSPRVISDPLLGSLDLLPLVTLQAPSLWTPPPYPFLWTPSCPRGTFQPPTFGNPMTPSPFPWDTHQPPPLEHPSGPFPVHSPALPLDPPPRGTVASGPHMYA